MWRFACGDFLTFHSFFFESNFFLSFICFLLGIIPPPPHLQIGGRTREGRAGVGSYIALIVCSLNGTRTTSPELRLKWQKAISRKEMRKKLITSEIGFLIKVLVLEEEHVDGAVARVNIPERVRSARGESLERWKNPSSAGKHCVLILLNLKNELTKLERYKSGG